MDIRSFGKRISSARKQEKMTQRALAALVRISPQYLNDIEHGRRNPPSNKVLERMAATLRMPLFFLQLLAGRLPDCMDISRYTPKTVERALDAFVNELQFLD